jgi:hypothetical protein
LDFEQEPQQQPESEPSLQEEPQQFVQPQQQRRPSNAERRAQTKQARDRTLQENRILRAQVDRLSQQVASFEPRFQQIDINRAQQHMAELERQFNEQQRAAADARRRMSDAMAAANSDGMAEALDARDQAMQRSEHLRLQREGIAQALRQGGHVQQGEQGAPPPPQQWETTPPPQQQRRPVPTRVRELADDFASENDWMDTQDRLPDGRPRDVDTRIMLELDESVLADGFDPATADYWEELRDRAARYLPHRFDAEPAPQRRNGASRQQSPHNGERQMPERRGPPVAAPSDRSPANPNRFFLNADRRQALIDAGILDRQGRPPEDDEGRKRLQRFVRQYQRYDRENGVARA